MNIKFFDFKGKGKLINKVKSKPSKDVYFDFKKTGEVRVDTSKKAGVEELKFLINKGYQPLPVFDFDEKQEEVEDLPQDSE